MLFHIKQSHAPQDCPYGKGGRDLSSTVIEGRQDPRYWLAFPQHTTYLVVETEESPTFKRSCGRGQA